MLRRLCALLVLLGVATAFAQADPWSRFRGPNGAGVAQGQDLPVEIDPAKHVRWKTPIPGQGASSPVVWNKSIYLQTANKEGTERTVLSVNADSGAIDWRRTFPGVAKKLRQESSLASASAAVDADGIFIPVWDGEQVHLKAFNHQGDLLWNKSFGRWVSQHGPGSSPVIVGDKVIFAYDMDAKDAKDKPLERPATLMAFDKKTGNLVWETPRPAYRACYSAPFVLERNGHNELIVTSTLEIAGYDPNTGKELWSWDWDWAKVKVKWPLRTVAGSVVVDDTLIASSGDGGGDRRMVALHLPKGGGAPTFAWGDGNKYFPYVPSPLAHGKHVYFVNDRGFAGCYEAKTGKEVWYERVTGATFLASPVLVDGLIYAPSVEGDVHVIAAEPTYKHLARSSLGERFRASPAVADGRLYLRGENHLICVGKK